MPFSYANAGSGPSAGGIGWFNFENITLNPGASLTNLTGTLNDGSTVTFDIKSLPTSTVPYTALPTAPPGFSYFGPTGYTGIVGNVTLRTPLLPSYATASVLVLSNIVVKDSGGNLVPNYTAVVADAESTNSFPQYTENLTITTNGTPWSVLTTIGGNPPAIAGVGTTNVVITGLNQGLAASNVLTTQNPNSLTLSSYGREGFAVGFAVTKIKVCKNIGGRINTADQFVVDIAGTPNNQITTTGSSVGMQSPCAIVYGVPGSAYTIKEIMAPGSVSLLSDYTQTISAVNISPGGSVPPTGSLPINFTPALGDIVNYTILNSAPPIFKKSVDKAFAKPGDIITYKVTGVNPNNYPLANVVFTDPTPTGVNYIGNLVVSVPYTGTTPATGLTLTMPANSTVTASWQVQVSASAPVSNPIVNIASANVPGGASGTTNPVSTQINYADLTSAGNIVKSVTPSFAQFGDTLTYTIVLHNTGNVAANNVVVTDPIPVGTTYVAGSTTATAPFTGDPTSVITLSNPIPAGGSVSVTYKVKVGNSAPPSNQISNVAKADYTFTVDPALPNGQKASGVSNTVLTPVSTARLAIVKSASESIGYVGDIITYNISVTNTGNVLADKVIVNDPVPNGTLLVPGSLSVNVPYTGSLPNISLTGAILPGETVTITYQVKVTAIPNPNPIKNVAKADFAFTVAPNQPNGVSGTSASNSADTLIFANNYRQQISDLIESVALQEAALGAIANAEGAKIQKIVAMPNVTPAILLCLNKSVTDMTNATALLESILVQKLNTVDCQINGNPKC